MGNPFSLFNADHLWALFIVILLSIAIPYWLKRPGSESGRRPFEISLGLIMFAYGVAKPFIGVFVMGEDWHNWLPLHMCQISNFLIAYALLSGKRGLLFEVIYFWTFAGASMAMITPDLAYGWPDLNYVMFMITHFILLVGALYFTIVEGHRPTGKSIWRVYKVSLYAMLVVLPLNYIIGGTANYFYLRYPPMAGSLMDFLPAPPLHIPFVMVLGYLAFWLVYAPLPVMGRIRGLIPARKTA
jgi:hypothetical integral membrane protein (TIGR02206 family)